MNELKGACIIGQSGGPTSVINASAAGVFIEALKQEKITAVYGAEKYDQYLTQLYGNWRELPPESKRVSHHDYLYCNLHKGYGDE